MKKIVVISLASIFCFIPKGMLAQGVAVDFSKYEGSQIVNSDFEDWSGSDYSNVPVGWHSFESVDGSAILVTFAQSTKHTSRNTTDLHEGTIGGSCLKLVPRKIGNNLIANGTISTGRMHAGAYIATDPKNHAYMDISSSATSNGTPFYALLTKRPTALSVWVKFTQGAIEGKHPYATVSAAITNGKRYQEPTADNDSSMVIGYAQNNKIETKGGEWQHLYIPFRYDSEQFNHFEEPKAIMVTFSTNAEPGEGSADDVLLVDDLELIYTQKVTIPETGFATLTNIAMENHKVMIPEGITAYTLTANARGELMVKETYKAGQVLPYHGAVLLKGKPGDYEFHTTLYDKEDMIQPDEDVCMVRGYEINTLTDEYKFYRLGENSGVLGFYEVHYGAKIKEDEALLRVKADQADKYYLYVLEKPEMKGDINNDGLVNITDVIILVNRLLGNLEKGKFFIPDVDVNGDGIANITDAVNLVNIILGK